MEDLTPYYEIIEQCIAKLGIDPAICRSDSRKGKWVLRKGSVQVTINIMYIEREDRSYCHIVSPIMRVPQNKQKELFSYSISWVMKLLKQLLMLLIFN